MHCRLSRISESLDYWIQFHRLFVFKDGLAELLNDEEEALATVEKHLRKRNDKAKLYENTGLWFTRFKV